MICYPGVEEIMNNTEKLLKYVKDKYGTEPEILWPKYPGDKVLRHSDSPKWYAIIMDIDRSRLGLKGEGIVDIVNFKTDGPLHAEALCETEGIIPAYHMNKNTWISVLLDGTVPFEMVKKLADASYRNTSGRTSKDKSRPPKEWLVPANPKYYDVEKAFIESDLIDWKQGAGIIEGDTVFMYVGSPVSAILYKCVVERTDIPFSYEDENLRIDKLMKIRLLRRYGPEEFPFKVLNDRYGIFAVRGPRGVPARLSKDLNK